MWIVRKFFVGCPGMYLCVLKSLPSRHKSMKQLERDILRLVVSINGTEHICSKTFFDILRDHTDDNVAMMVINLCTQSSLPDIFQNLQSIFSDVLFEMNGNIVSGRKKQDINIDVQVNDGSKDTIKISYNTVFNIVDENAQPNASVNVYHDIIIYQGELMDVSYARYTIN